MLGRSRQTCLPRNPCREWYSEHSPCTFQRYSESIRFLPQCCWWCQAHLEKEEEKGKRREAKFYGEKYITTSMKKIKHKIRTWEAIRSLVPINVKSSRTIFARSRRAVRKFLISSCETFNALTVFLVRVVVPVLTGCTHVARVTVLIRKLAEVASSARTETFRGSDKIPDAILA